MKRPIIILIVFGLLALVLVLYLIFRDFPRSGPIKPIAGNVLYLLPEVGGFDTKDIVLTADGNLLGPDTASKMFPGGIAVVANNSDPEGLDSQYSNSKVTKLATDSGLVIRKWISFYFGKDGKWCRCQNCDTTETDPNKFNCCKYQTLKQSQCLTNTTDTSTVIDNIYTLCETIPDLEGIMFDDEVGDPTYIIKALEGVKTMWDKSTNKRLKLGWTSGVSAAKLPRPRNLPGKYIWDICLGQAYTNDTGSYYSGSCTPSETWWSSVKTALGDSSASKGVPMVCGSGNCIGDKESGQIKCYDERLSGNVITNLIKDRPSDFSWKNFGIWYGTYNQDKSNTQTGHGFFNCVNNNCPITTGCCKNGWVIS
tara:strand:- start:264 stop:1364 length:1101 start_codon:yes stop_codon:yes gene_type:complete